MKEIDWKTLWSFYCQLSNLVDFLLCLSSVSMNKEIEIVIVLQTKHNSTVACNVNQKLNKSQISGT